MWRSEVLSHTLTSIKITKKPSIWNPLSCPPKMLKNSHWGQLVTKKINTRKSSPSVWQSSLQVFWRTPHRFTIWRLSLLTGPEVLSWSTNGRTQSITHKFSEVSLRTWWNSTLNRDLALHNFGLGSANTSWTSSQRRNSWLPQSQQISRDNWAIWGNWQRAQTTQNSTKPMSTPNKSNTDNWFPFHPFISSSIVYWLMFSLFLCSDRFIFHLFISLFYVLIVSYIYFIYLFHTLILKVHVLSVQMFL